ncbi:hypothetical protein NQZ79_g3995 [Umbelopsis isabellina]|nr:hypothetical protein NQZ79_g3995 [Umbelopsis isabellina]
MSFTNDTTKPCTSTGKLSQYRGVHKIDLNCRLARNSTTINSSSTSSIPTVLFIQHTIIIMPGFLKIVNVKKQNKTAMSGKSQKQVKATRNYSSTMPAKTLYSALI